jgi:hypothetical protein
MQGSHEIAVQSGKWGYYAVVRLEIELEAGSRAVRIDFGPVGPDWRAGVQFGIAYAYEKTLAAQRPAPGAVVTVTEVKGHPVDTKEAVVALAAALAFCKAVGAAPPPGLRLQESAGEIVFPK